jgi:predicted transcriptional regulator
MANNFATKPKTKLTAHQMDVLRIVIKGNEQWKTTDAEFHADLDQVLERCKRQTTKSSIQFTVRALIMAGLIEKLPQQERRGRMRAIFKATTLGTGVGADRPALPAYIEQEGLFEV